MQLSEFIDTKPKGIHLGRYFYNTYAILLKPQEIMSDAVQVLYYTANPILATSIIHDIMERNQWKELP